MTTPKVAAPVAKRRKPPARAKPDPNKLPIKEELFVAAYLAHGNATAAAKAAGYSEKTAHAKGSELCKRPRVAAAIEQAKRRIISKYEVSAERTLEEMALIGHSDIRNYLINGRPIEGVTLAPGAPDSAMRAIKKLRQKGHVVLVGTGKKKKEVIVYETEIEFWSKDGQLRNIGEHLALFKENRPLDKPPANPDDELTTEQRNDRIISLLVEAQKRKKKAAGKKVG